MANDSPNERLKRMARNMEFGDEMAEIVRRLAEEHPSDWDMIAFDAARLWAKMRKEAGDGA